MTDVVDTQQPVAPAPEQQIPAPVVEDVQAPAPQQGGAPDYSQGPPMHPHPHPHHQHPHHQHHHHQRPPMYNNRRRYNLRKTRLCRTFEANGECQFGDSCWFAHGEADRREYQPQNNYRRRNHAFAKTKMCKFITAGSACPYNENCSFAHSNLELRPAPVMMYQPRPYMMRPRRPIDASRYKTRMCKSFNMQGFCKFGDSCAFAHGPQDLRTPPPFAVPPQMGFGDFQPHYYPEMNPQFNPAAPQQYMYNPAPQGQPAQMVPAPMMN